jgi:YHS domain-containing protein
VFYFSSEIARKRFKATPEKYAPIQGGSDIVLAAEENRAVPGTVNHSAVWRGRLYLFASSETLATFQEDPARYAN